MKVNCPECSEDFNATINRSTKEVRCSKCGKSLKVENGKVVADDGSVLLDVAEELGEEILDSALGGDDGVILDGIGDIVSNVTDIFD